MPFQSEKQRRYLWANEPEIARDWTDTYGSRVKKQLGGILDIGYHGSPSYQNIMGQGFKGGAGQSSRILGMNIPTWAGKGRTYVASNPNVALRYGAPLEVAKSARNFTMPFGGGFDKSGISFGKETALDPKQATKGMRLMDKLRSGIYSGSPTAQRLLQTGTTAATTGSGLARALFGPLGLGSAYVGGAAALQENLPESLQGVISDDIISGGAMGAGAGQDVAWDTALKYGDPIQRSAFQDDYNYTPQETMGTNWSNLMDTQRRQELSRLAGMEQYPTEDEDEDTGGGNWLRNITSLIPFLGKNTRSGAALRMLGNRFMPDGGIANFANTMRRGVSQNAFEQARNVRRIQSRIDSMKQRREDDKGYSKTNLANLLKQLGQKDDWSPPKPKPSPRPYSPPARPHGGNGGGNQGGGGGQAAADAAGGSSMSSPFNRGGLAWLR